VSTGNDMSAENDDQSVRLERGLARFRSSAARAERRRRLGSALSAAASVAPWSLLIVAGALALVKLRPAEERWVYLAAGVGLALVAGRALWAALGRRAPLAGAIELDRFHETGGRIANAIAFSRIPPAERSPLMALAIEDALTAVTRVEPRRAVPLSVPRETPLVALLLVGLAALALVEVRTVRPIPAKPAPIPLLMSPDDLTLFRHAGEELARSSRDPVQQAAVGRYNRLVEDIAEHRVDQHEVFRRLAEIERDLGEHLDADRAALDEGLKGIARELEKSPLARKAAEALSDKRLADAEQALRELAEKLKSKKAPPSQAELERLRSALKQASEQSHERTQAIEQRRRELQAERESLLKKKADPNPKTSAAAEKKLEENKRQLEHLDRQSSRAKQSAEELSELDKELAKAAEDLQKAMKEKQSGGGEAPQDLERGAEKLNRMGQKKLSDEQKRELIQKLKEMREVMRQEGQGGEQRKARLERFGEKARGQKPGEGQGQQAGKPGGKLELKLGRGGNIPIPGTQSGSQGKPSSGQGSEQANGAQTGEGAGHGHDGNIAGERTRLPGGQTHDVTAAGIDSGEGSASAEVIYGAAQRGFVGREYKDIFTEYQSVAEQVIEKDEIPPGYRFYVRRYFQLIRPRE
jgi:hypothetical protein